MFKNLSLLFFFFLIISCKNEQPNSAENANTPEETNKLAPLIKDIAEEKVNGENLEKLKANAFDVNDTFGRVNHSLGQVQKQFDQSNRMRPKDGTQRIFVDKKLTVIIKKEVGEDVFEAKVNLKNIDHKEGGGVRLIPDQELDQWPGFAISVLEGKPGVEMIKNGKKTGEERELAIYMADRILIEQTVPAFLQALNTVHGRN